MDKELINELKIANLLKAIELMGEKKNKEEIDKIIEHVYNTEVDGLLYNVSLFPRKEETHTNKFYGGFNK